MGRWVGGYMDSIAYYLDYLDYLDIILACNPFSTKFIHILFASLLLTLIYDSPFIFTSSIKLDTKDLLTVGIASDSIDFTVPLFTKGPPCNSIYFERRGGEGDIFLGVEQHDEYAWGDCECDVDLDLTGISIGIDFILNYSTIFIFRVFMYIDMNTDTDTDTDTDMDIDTDIDVYLYIFYVNMDIDIDIDINIDINDFMEID